VNWSVKRWRPHASQAAKQRHNNSLGREPQDKINYTIQPCRGDTILISEDLIRNTFTDKEPE